MTQGSRARRMAALLVGTLIAVAAVPASVGAASPAVAAPCSVKNVTKGTAATSDLQAAITAASAKNVLSITGVCAGTFVIGKPLTLKKGATAGTLQGDGGRVLEIRNNPAGAAVNITGLTIRGGTTTTCEIFASYPCGAGVFNVGRVVLDKVTIRDNTIDAGAGGGAYGTGAYNAPAGVMTIKRSLITNNHGVVPFNNDGGGAALANDGTALISSTRIIGNQGTGEGHIGGTVYQDGGYLTIENSTIADNLDATTGPGRNAAGGAIYSIATLTVRGSTISGNTSRGMAYAHGGGIYAEGDTSITDTTITGNAVEDGRPPEDQDMTDWHGAFGGGISFEPGGSQKLVLKGVTIARNRASSLADAAYGGIYVAGDNLVRATIVAKNTAPTAPDCGLEAGHTTTGDHNLIGNNGSCSDWFTNGVKGNKVGTPAAKIDPKLGPLANNGGPTKTLALLAGSPAINKAGTAKCATPTDQRGIKRPQGSACDIGAYEKS